MMWSTYSLFIHPLRVPIKPKLRKMIVQFLFTQISIMIIKYQNIFFLKFVALTNFLAYINYKHFGKNYFKDLKI